MPTIEKADIVRYPSGAEEVHFRCSCMKADAPDEVYGLDGIFTAKRAAQEFALRHKVLHDRPLTHTSLPELVGQDTETASQT